MRASSVPNLYAFCLNKRTCIFVRTGRLLLLILRFWGRHGPKNGTVKMLFFCAFAKLFGVSFLVPPDGPKNGTVKMLFFCAFTKLCLAVPFWDRV